MTDQNKIIGARQPFLNADGTVSPPWFRFLEALASASSSNTQLTPQDVLLFLTTDDSTDSTTQQRLKDVEILSWLGDD